MARIIAPNKQYAVSAGVPFTGGEGHTDNEYLIKWFHDHGYEVIEEPEAEPETDPGKQSGTVTENAADESSADKPAEETAVAPAQKKGRKKEG